MCFRVGHAIPQKRECSHVKSFEELSHMCLPPGSTWNIPNALSPGLKYKQLPDQYPGETLICSVFYVIFMSYHFRVLSHLQLS